MIVSSEDAFEYLADIVVLQDFMRNWDVINNPYLTREEWIDYRESLIIKFRTRESHMVETFKESWYLSTSAMASLMAWAWTGKGVGGGFLNEEDFTNSTYLMMGQMTEVDEWGVGVGVAAKDGGALNRIYKHDELFKEIGVRVRFLT